MTDTATGTNSHKEKLRKRFTEAQPKPPTDAEFAVSEKACDYIYRAVDRQINKARGVLAYNGLLFASFSLAARSSTSTDKNILMLASVGAIVALSSCFPLLYLMVFDVGDAANYENAKNDFEATFDAVWSRRPKLQISLGLSLFATLVALFLPIIFLSELPH
jgi:hypothetical protein